MAHQKKKGHQMSKIFKSRKKAIAMAICPISVHFIA